MPEQACKLARISRGHKVRRAPSISRQGHLGSTRIDSGGAAVACHEADRSMLLTNTADKHPVKRSQGCLKVVRWSIAATNMPHGPRCGQRDLNGCVKEICAMK